MQTYRVQLVRSDSVPVYISTLLFHTFAYIVYTQEAGTILRFRCMQVMITCRIVI